MRRNRAALVTRAIERAAWQAAQGAAFGSPRVMVGGVRLAGQVDPVTDTWLPYGQLDVTPIENFRLAPAGIYGVPEVGGYGKLDVTPIGEFRLAPGGKS